MRTGDLTVNGRRALIGFGGMSLATYSDVGCTPHHSEDDPGPGWAEIVVFFDTDFVGIPEIPLFYLRYVTGYPEPRNGEFPKIPPPGGYFELVAFQAEVRGTAVLYGSGQLVGAVPEPGLSLLLAIGASIVAARVATRRSWR